MTNCSTFTNDSAGWRLEHSYASLPELFHVRVNPTSMPSPRMVIFNDSLAESLGLNADLLREQESAAIFAGNVIPPGAMPLAQAYAGHQFGHFTKLGDGRAILLGEQITPAGERMDIQFKGSGRTPFSRGGDGRSALGPMLREYIISESMHALGIPTTRSLAVVTTGEIVRREDPLPGAVLTRVASSHIRVGTFEWASANNDHAALQALLDYTAQRHYYPVLAGAENLALALFEAVMERQSELIARWLCVGFIHGVMNTDNMAVSGETIDYGPCAFMDSYHSSTVFSSIDHQGRYAYSNQAPVAQWNLARLAESLLPLMDSSIDRALELANEAIQRWPEMFERHWLARMRAKLGIFNEESGDADLISALLEWMEKSGVDFTNTFRDLSTDHPLSPDPTFSIWHERWVERLKRQPQSLAESQALRRSHNPVVIPRNHKVEEALAAASQHGDFTSLQSLLSVVAEPFDYTTNINSEYSSPPDPGAPAYQTFCGT